MCTISPLSYVSALHAALDRRDAGRGLDTAERAAVASSAIPPRCRPSRNRTGCSALVPAVELAADRAVRRIDRLAGLLRRHARAFTCADRVSLLSVLTHPHMEQLFWLPTHPDLRAAVAAARAPRNVRAPSGRCGRAGRLQAGLRRDRAAGSIDRRVCQRSRRPGQLALRSVLTPARVALACFPHRRSSACPRIAVAGVHRRLAISTHVAPYGVYRQSLLRKDRAACRLCTAVHCSRSRIRTTSLSMCRSMRPKNEVAQAIAARIEEIRRYWRGARELYSAQPIQQTLVPATPPLFGSFEALVPAAPFADDGAAEHGHPLRGQTRRRPAARPGLACRSRRRTRRRPGSVAPGEAARQPDARAAVWRSAGARSWPQRVACRASASCLTSTTRCGAASSVTTALEGTRTWARARRAARPSWPFSATWPLLAKRGIVLAVCSKNDPDVAEAAFASIRRWRCVESDIACFVANWDDKADEPAPYRAKLDLGSRQPRVRRRQPGRARHHPARAARGRSARAARRRGRTMRARSALRAISSRPLSLPTTPRAAPTTPPMPNGKPLQEVATDLDGYLRSLEMNLVVTGVGPPSCRARRS